VTVLLGLSNQAWITGFSIISFSKEVIA